MKRYISKNGKLIQISHIEDICEQLIETFKFQEEQNTRLREENEELRDSAYQSKELAKMKKELDKMEEDYFRGFPISAEEEQKLLEWQRRHIEEMHQVTSEDSKIALGGAIGGRWTYYFTPTSIGTVGVCRCNSCYHRNSYYKTLKDKAEYVFQELI